MKRRKRRLGKAPSVTQHLRTIYQRDATALGISEGTVKFHINNLLSKLKVSDRTRAAILALKRGIANL